MLTWDHKRASTAAHLMTGLELLSARPLTALMTWKTIFCSSGLSLAPRPPLLTARVAASKIAPVAGMQAINDRLRGVWKAASLYDLDDGRVVRGADMELLITRNLSSSSF